MKPLIEEPSVNTKRDKVAENGNLNKTTDGCYSSCCCGCCCRCCCRCLCVGFVCAFTYWPYKRVKEITSIYLEHNNNSTQCQCTLDCCRLTCIRFLLALVPISLIIFGVFSQMITCFSRQNPYAHWVHDPNDNLSNNISTNSNTRYCLLKCDINKNFITSFIFPDAIIALLALWIYLVNPLIKIIMKTEDRTIEELLIVVRDKGLKEFCCTSSCYILISMGYIISSLSISILYLFAFGIVRVKKDAYDAVMQSAPIPLGKNKAMIFLSFLGFLAFDLLYIQVIMRYAYQCTLLVYYLDSINYELKDLCKDNVANPTSTVTHTDNVANLTTTVTHTDSVANLTTTVTHTDNVANLTTTVTDVVISKLPNYNKGDVKSAYEFLKQLNATSRTTEMVIIIAGFTAINCVINLFNTTDCPIYSSNKEANSEITYKIMQVAAVTSRAFLWIFVVLFPFHKAAQVNEASSKLRFKIALYHPQISKGAKYIASEIRLIGIRVHPWLPYVVFFVIIFVIMMGSNIISYIHFL